MLSAEKDETLTLQKVTYQEEGSDLHGVVNAAFRGVSFDTEDMFMSVFPAIHEMIIGNKNTLPRTREAYVYFSEGGGGRKVTAK